MTPQDYSMLHCVAIATTGWTIPAAHGHAAANALAVLRIMLEPLRRGVPRRSRRQHHHGLDLEQRARAGELRHADRGARRRRRHIEVAVAHLAEGADVLADVDDVVVDLDDVLRLGADGIERGF